MCDEKRKKRKEKNVRHCGTDCDHAWRREGLYYFVSYYTGCTSSLYSRGWTLSRFPQLGPRGLYHHLLFPRSLSLSLSLFSSSISSNAAVCRCLPAKKEKKKEKNEAFAFYGFFFLGGGGADFMPTKLTTRKTPWMARDFMATDLFLALVSFTQRSSRPLTRAIRSTKQKKTKKTKRGA